MRKDTEGASGILVAQIHILARPSRLFNPKSIAGVMKMCILLQNMVVEHRQNNYESDMSSLAMLKDVEDTLGRIQTFKWESKSALELLLRGELPAGMGVSAVENREGRRTNTVEHLALKRDLVYHIWERHGCLEIKKEYFERVRGAPGVGHCTNEDFPNRRYMVSTNTFAF